MTRRRLHSLLWVGLAGAVFPFLLVVAWGALSMIRHPPMSRLMAFLDPYSAHRVLNPGTVAFDAMLGALIGLAISLLMARLVRHDRWLACIAFLGAFAAACIIQTVLHEGWARMPAALAQPPIFGFTAAVITGFWLAPRAGAWIAARRTIDGNAR